MSQDAPAGELTLAYDAARNLIHARGAGVWTVAQMERQLRDFDYAAIKARREHGCVRFLVDLREAGVQTPEMSALMTERGERLYLPGDRLALIVASDLLREQLMHVSRQAAFAIFLSRDTAERWLLAHDAAKRTDDLSIEWGDDRDDVATAPIP